MVRAMVPPNPDVNFTANWAGVLSVGGQRCAARGWRRRVRRRWIRGGGVWGWEGYGGVCGSHRAGAVC